MFTPRQITLLDLRKRCGDVVDDAYHEQPFEITRMGRRRAYIISPDMFDELTELRAARDAGQLSTQAA